MICFLFKPHRWLPAALAFVCCVFQSAFTGNRGSIGKNAKPAAPFTVPEQNYIYFAAMGDQGEGSPAQHHVAELMKKKSKKSWWW